MKRFLGALPRLANLGVAEGMSAAGTRHVRFCNMATLASVAFACSFFVLELPVVTDWGQTRPLELAILGFRALAVPVFALPLWLNSRRRYGAARCLLVGWSLVFIVSSSLIFGANAPSHLFIIVVAAAVLAMFPEEDERLMWGSVSACAIAFGAALWLRQVNVPLVPVHREGVRLAMEIVISSGALLLSVIVTWVMRETTRRAELQATVEQERADRLLLNILPETIARRLKDDPQTIADGFHEVTVLFADLVGFTPISEKLTPRETLQLMDDVFSRFDSLVDQFGLEKIKTVGDAYMLAGGLPAPNERHAADVAQMALAMLDTVRAIEGPDGTPLRLRIGMATGPVVAGVIGKKKFLYDLWGDTVNTASRMESLGEPDRIQVNETTWRQLQSRFEFSERGLIEVKGKGQMRTWFLTGGAEDAPA